MLSPRLAPGVWGVVATPFRGPALDVDTVSLAREIEHYVSVGATGVVVLGVFGEAGSLSVQERAVVLRTAREASASLPIVVGAKSLATAPAIEEAHRAAEIVGDGLAGVMLQVNSARAETLHKHLDGVHDATRVRLIVQHYPEAGGSQIGSDALVAVLHDAPYVAAVKCENAPTVPEIARIFSATTVPAFGGLGGTGLLDELAAGAAGAMTGFSCPEGLIACVEAYRRGGIDAAREAWLPFLPLANFEFQRGLGLAIRKESLRRRGLIAEAGVRAPAAEMPAFLVPTLTSHLGYALARRDLVPAGPAGAEFAVPVASPPSRQQMPSATRREG